MRILFCIILLIGSINRANAETDSLYIQSYPGKLSISGFLVRDLLLMTVETLDEEVSYWPNNPAELGMGLTLDNTVISFAYGYGFDFLRDKKRGKTKSFDLQLHSYGQKWVFDFVFQRYEGFYKEYDDSDLAFELCPDLRINQYGLNVQYVFNNKQFSYKAAYSQNEKQLRSVGSWLVGAGVYLSNIRSDSTFIYKGKNDLNNFQFGINGGYTYSWVLGKHWLINCALTVGISIGSEKINKFGEEKIKVSPNAFPRISFCYTHTDWAVGLTLVNSITYPSFSNKHMIGLYSGNVQLSYMRRFENVPFLSNFIK